jgi:hypothetical protein
LSTVALNFIFNMPLMLSLSIILNFDKQYYISMAIHNLISKYIEILCCSLITWFHFFYLHVDVLWFSSSSQRYWLLFYSYIR